MVEQDFYRTWKAQVNAIPRLRRYTAVGIGTSYPMLAYTESGLRLRHFYHDAEQTGPDTMSIGPARLLVTLDYETYDVLDANFELFDGITFDTVEYHLSAEERAALHPDIQSLRALYDVLLAPYPAPPDTSVVNEFMATLERVVPPMLWPYYAILGENFLVLTRD